MYPLIMLFIASGQLVGRLAVAGDATFIDSLVSIIATFGPLFLIPATFKFAGSAVATIAGALSNASEKQKGDIRDPNSLRSRLKQRRGQRYGRMLGGHVQTPRFSANIGGKTRTFGGGSIMPSMIRRAYNRLPNTDSSGGLMSDILKARDDVSTLAKTLGDETVRAMAVTGAGQNKGVRVRTADGGYEWAGYKKLGKHFATDGAGRIMTHNGLSSGIAMLQDADGSLKQAGSKDFYDRDTMSQVRKYGSLRGSVAAAAEHTMSKTNSNDARDYEQVWAGINSTGYTKDEKIAMSQGVWNKVKDADVVHKFSDFDSYFADGQKTLVDGSGAMQNGTMKVKFKKMVDYIDANFQQYPLQNQRSLTWDALTDGMVSYSNSGKKAADQSAGQTQTLEQLHGIAYKAMGIVNQTRSTSGGSRVIPAGEDGAPIAAGGVAASGSSATGGAARAAERFLDAYRKNIGELPTSDTSGMFIPPKFH